VMETVIPPATRCVDASEPNQHCRRAREIPVICFKLVYIEQRPCRGSRCPIPRTDDGRRRSRQRWSSLSKIAATRYGFMLLFAIHLLPGDMSLLADGLRTRRQWPATKQRRRRRLLLSKVICAMIEVDPPAVFMTAENFLQLERHN